MTRSTSAAPSAHDATDMDEISVDGTSAWEASDTSTPNLSAATPSQLEPHNATHPPLPAATQPNQPVRSSAPTHVDLEAARARTPTSPSLIEMVDDTDPERDPNEVDNSRNSYPNPSRNPTARTASQETEATPPSSVTCPDPSCTPSPPVSTADQPMSSNFDTSARVTRSTRRGRDPPTQTSHEPPEQRSTRTPTRHLRRAHSVGHRPAALQGRNTQPSVLAMLQRATTPGAGQGEHGSARLLNNTRSPFSSLEETTNASRSESASFVCIPSNSSSTTTGNSPPQARFPDNTTAAAASPTTPLRLPAAQFNTLASAVTNHTFPTPIVICGAFRPPIAQQLSSNASYTAAASIPIASPSAQRTLLQREGAIATAADASDSTTTCPVCGEVVLDLIDRRRTHANSAHASGYIRSSTRTAMERWGLQLCTQCRPPLFYTREGMARHVTRAHTSGSSALQTRNAPAHQPRSTSTPAPMRGSTRCRPRGRGRGGNHTGFATRGYAPGTTAQQQSDLADGAPPALVQDRQDQPSLTTRETQLINNVHGAFTDFQHMRDLEAARARDPSRPPTLDAALHLLMTIDNLVIAAQVPAPGCNSASASSTPSGHLDSATAAIRHLPGVSPARATRHAHFQATDASSDAAHGNQETTAAAPRVNPVTGLLPSECRQLLRALACNKLGRALSILERAPLADVTLPTVRARLSSLLAPAPPPTPEDAELYTRTIHSLLPAQDDEQPPPISIQELVDAAASLNVNAAAPLRGMTTLQLKRYIAFVTGMNVGLAVTGRRAQTSLAQQLLQTRDSAPILTFLHDCLTTNISTAALRRLLALRGVALVKDPTTHAVRPIGMPQTLLKLLGTIVARRAAQSPAFRLSRDLSVGTPDGPTAGFMLVSTARHLVPHAAVLQLDYSNAYNSVQAAHVASATRFCASLQALVRLRTLAPQEVHYSGKDGDDLTILQDGGLTQGATESPVVFACAMESILNAAQQLTGNRAVYIMGYQDDVAALVFTPSDLPAVMDITNGASAVAGLRLQRTKVKLLLPLEIESASTDGADTAHPPREHAEDGSTGAAPPRPRATRQQWAQACVDAGLPPPVQSIKLLGAFVGSPARVQHDLQAHAIEPALHRATRIRGLPQQAQDVGWHGNVLQHVLAMMSSSVTPRLTHVARCTPPHLFQDAGQVYDACLTADILGCMYTNGTAYELQHYLSAIPGISDPAWCSLATHMLLSPRRNGGAGFGSLAALVQGPAHAAAWQQSAHRIWSQLQHHLAPVGIPMPATASARVAVTPYLPGLLHQHNITPEQLFDAPQPHAQRTLMRAYNGDAATTLCDVSRSPEDAHATARTRSVANALTRAGAVGLIPSVHNQATDAAVRVRAACLLHVPLSANVSGYACACGALLTPELSDQGTPARHAHPLRCASGALTFRHDMIKHGLRAALMSTCGATVTSEPVLTESGALPRAHDNVVTQKRADLAVVRQTSQLLIEITVRSLDSTTSAYPYHNPLRSLDAWFNSQVGLKLAEYSSIQLARGQQLAVAVIESSCGLMNNGAHNALRTLAMDATTQRRLVSSLRKIIERAIFAQAEITGQRIRPLLRTPATNTHATPLPLVAATTPSDTHAATGATRMDTEQDGTACTMPAVPRSCTTLQAAGASHHLQERFSYWRHAADMPVITSMQAAATSEPAIASLRACLVPTSGTLTERQHEALTITASALIADALGADMSDAAETHLRHAMDTADRLFLTAGIATDLTARNINLQSVFPTCASEALPAQRLLQLLAPRTHGGDCLRTTDDSVHQLMVENLEAHVHGQHHSQAEHDIDNHPQDENLQHTDGTVLPVLTPEEVRREQHGCLHTTPTQGDACHDTIEEDTDDAHGATSGRHRQHPGPRAEHLDMARVAEALRTRTLSDLYVGLLYTALTHDTLPLDRDPLRRVLNAHEYSVVVFAYRHDLEARRVTAQQLFPTGYRHIDAAQQEDLLHPQALGGQSHILADSEPHLLLQHAALKLVAGEFGPDDEQE